MKNKWFKIIVAMTLVLLLAFAAVACADEPEDTDDTAVETTDSAPETTAEQTEPLADKVTPEGANTDDSWDEVLPM